MRQRQRRARSTHGLHMSELQPLLVPVVEARRLLGGIGNNTFWKLAKAGELELVGTERKRWVVVASIHAYVAKEIAAANAAKTARASPAEARHERAREATP